MSKCFLDWPTLLLLEMWKPRDVLIFYCRVANYHKLGGWNNSSFTSSPFSRSEDGVGLAEFSAWGPTGGNHGIYQAGLLPEGSRECLIADSFRCLAELGSLSGSLVPVSFCLLEAPPIPSHWFSLFSKPAITLESFSCFRFLWLPLLLPVGKQIS